MQQPVGLDSVTFFWWHLRRPGRFRHIHYRSGHSRMWGKTVLLHFQSWCLSCLAALTVSLSGMSNRDGKTRHLYSRPDFRGAVFGLLPLIVKSVVAFFIFKNYLLWDCGQSLLFLVCWEFKLRMNVGPVQHHRSLRFVLFCFNTVT